MKRVVLVGSPLLLLWAAGCESDSGPNMRQRQEDALRDPFGYGPSVPTTGPARLGAGEYDVQDSRGLKSDLNRLFR